MATGDYEMREEERLPWLETVEDEDVDGPSVVRVVLLIVLALALVVTAILGYRYYKQHQASDGNGALIAAPEGDYKVKPDDPGGLQVEGEGDSAIATSDGATPDNASVDMQAAPETPIAGKKAAPVTADAGASKAVTAIPAPAIPVGGSTASRGALVQLGSFASAAEADTTWASVAKKYPHLAGLSKSVEAAHVGGRTVYRLRVNAGAAAAAASLCAKLSAAGQACVVPKA